MQVFAYMCFVFLSSFVDAGICVHVFCFFKYNCEGSLEFSTTTGLS
jgi:hypothetical protein